MGVKRNPNTYKCFTTSLKLKAAKLSIGQTVGAFCY